MDIHALVRNLSKNVHPYAIKSKDLMRIRDLLNLLLETFLKDTGTTSILRNRVLVPQRYSEMIRPAIPT